MRQTIFDENTEAAGALEDVLPKNTEKRAPGLIGFSSVCVEILNEAGYRAFIQDVECMWRWEIHRDGQLVQDGCSLSERSSREAVGHVMSFYRRRDASTALR